MGVWQRGEKAAWGGESDKDEWRGNNSSRVRERERDGGESDFCSKCAVMAELMALSCR